MKKLLNEDIGLEATLPTEAIKFLTNDKTTIEFNNKHDLSMTHCSDVFLDEYELAMIV